MVICWPGVASAVDICPPLKLLGQPAGGPLVKSNTSRFFFFFFSYFFFQLPGKEKEKKERNGSTWRRIFIYIYLSGNAVPFLMYPYIRERVGYIPHSRFLRLTCAMRQLGWASSIPQHKLFFFFLRESTDRNRCVFLIIKYIFLFFFEKERNCRSSSSDFYTSQKKTKNWKCAVVFHKTKKIPKFRKSNNKKR
jgi:hypothetical protein